MNSKLRHAVSLVHKDQWDQALASCDKVLAAYDSFETYDHGRVRISVNLSRVYKALALLNILPTTYQEHQSDFCFGVSFGGADLLADLGLFVEALAACDKALAAYESLSETMQKFRQDFRLVSEQILREISDLRGMSVLLDQALASCDEVLAAYESLPATAQKSTRYNWFQQLSVQVRILTMSVRLDQALAACDKTLAAYESLSETDQKRGRGHWFMALGTRVRILTRLGRLEEALAACDKALAAYESLSATKQKLVRLLYRSLGLGERVRILAKLGQWDEANDTALKLLCDLTKGDLISFWFDNSSTLSD